MDLTQARETITNHAAIINTLQVAINHIQPGQHSTKNKKIPDSTLYSSSRDELRNFFNSLKLKLIGDAAKFPSVQHQLVYTTQLLRGDVLNQIISHVTNGGVTLTTRDKWYHILKVAFGDPNLIRTARRQLS